MTHPLSSTIAAGAQTAASQYNNLRSDLFSSGKHAQGRLTLSYLAPLKMTDELALTPSATNTTNETVDFAAAHYWQTGQAVQVSASGSGLTAGTIYYVNAVDSDTISFYDTEAHALAGGSTGKIDLTGNVTASIYSAKLYYFPHHGEIIALYDGSTWEDFAIPAAGVQLSIVALSASTNYDIFLYDDSGTLTLEAVAWSSATARATELVKQDNCYVKSGATGYRYLGTIRMTATAGKSEDSQVKRFIWNLYNRILRSLYVTDATGSWAYSTSAWRQANNNTANQVEIIVGISEDFLFMMNCGFVNVGGGSRGNVSIGEDSAAAPATGASAGYTYIAGYSSVVAYMNRIPPLGYHYYTAIEYSAAAGTTYYGLAPNFLLVGQWRC